MLDSPLIGLVMVVGLLGVVVPVLPGTALILAAGMAWAALVVDGGTTRWVVVAVMAALFVAGTYVAEARRLGTGPEARRSTVQVLQAVGIGVLAELAAGVAMVATWLVGLAVT